MCLERFSLSLPFFLCISSFFATKLLSTVLVHTLLMIDAVTASNCPTPSPYTYKPTLSEATRRLFHCVFLHSPPLSSADDIRNDYKRTSVKFVIFSAHFHASLPI